MIIRIAGASRNQPYYMKRSTIVEIISALLILLFVYTSSSKLLAIQSFQVVLSTSPLIGENAKYLAWGIPVVEIFVSLLLVIPYTRLYGLYFSVGLMSVFTAYILYMLIFTPKLPCSCGGVIAKLSWPHHLIFNIVFTLLAMLGAWFGKKIKADSAKLKLQPTIG